MIRPSFGVCEKIGGALYVAGGPGGGVWSFHGRGVSVLGGASQKDVSILGYTRDARSLVSAG